MRVLFLVTRFPVPPWRGDQVRAYHQIQQLARRHDITLAALCAVPPTATMRAAVEAWGVRIAVVPLRTVGRMSALANVLIGDRRPLQTLWYEQPAAHRAVDQLLAVGRFDLVHAQLVRTAAYLPRGASPPVVLDFVDALSANMARRAAHSRGPIGWVSSLEARRLLRYERELLDRVAAAVVVAREDADLIAPGRVAVVPNGVDAERFPFAAGHRERPRIVFGGNLGYFPNIDAATWLACDIFPLIRAAVPSAELRLVGARPSRAVRLLGNLPGVTVAGDVPSMGDELASARVALLPMRAGTGLQNKVLEALAVGTPVVATSRAIAALAVQPGEHVLVESSAAGLARAATTLLSDPEAGSALAVAGRRLIDTHYLWPTAADALEAVWLQAAGQPPCSVRSV